MPRACYLITDLLYIHCDFLFFEHCPCPHLSLHIFWDWCSYHLGYSWAHLDCDLVSQTDPCLWFAYLLKITIVSVTYYALKSTHNSYAAHLSRIWLCIFVVGMLHNGMLLHISSLSCHITVATEGGFTPCKLARSTNQGFPLPTEKRCETLTRIPLALNLYMSHTVLSLEVVPLPVLLQIMSIIHSGVQARTLRTICDIHLSRVLGSAFFLLCCLVFTIETASWHPPHFLLLNLFSTQQQKRVFQRVSLSPLESSSEFSLRTVSQSAVFESIALTFRGNQLNLQILCPHPKPTVSGTLEVGTRTALTDLFSWFWCTLKLENHWFGMKFNVLEWLQSVSKSAFVYLFPNLSFVSLKLELFSLIIQKYFQSLCLGSCFLSPSSLVIGPLQSQ